MKALAKDRSIKVLQTKPMCHTQEFTHYPRSCPGSCPGSCPESCPQSRTADLPHRYCCRKELKSSLALTVLMLGMAPSVLAIETPDTWWKHAGYANYLMRKRQYSQSTSEFEIALRMMSTQGISREKIIDVKLCRIDSLIADLRLPEADREMTRLRAAEPGVPARNPLLEVRYFRRLADLRLAQKRYPEASAARRHSCDLLAAIFGKGSADEVDEQHYLLKALVAERNWRDALNVVREIRRYRAGYLPKDLRSMYGWWLDEFEFALVDVLQAELKTGRLPAIRQSVMIMEEYYSISRPSKSVWKLWQLATESANPDRDLSLQIAKFWLERIAIAKATKEELQMLVSACAPPMFTRIFANQFDGQTEQLSFTALYCLQRLLDKDARKRNLLYIQVACMQSWTLAKIGRIAEAESLMDSVEIDPEFLTESFNLNGVFQARYYGLAAALAERGDRQGVQRQIEKSRKLLRSMHNVQDRAVLEGLWEQHGARLIKEMRK